MVLKHKLLGDMLRVDKGRIFMWGGELLNIAPLYFSKVILGDLIDKFKRK